MGRQVPPSACPVPRARARARRRGPPAASGGGPNLRWQRKIDCGSRCVDGPGDRLEIADDPFGLPVPGGIGPYQHLEQIGERPAVRLYKVPPEPCRRKRGRKRTRCRLPCGAPRRRCGPGRSEPAASRCSWRVCSGLRSPDSRSGKTGGSTCRDLFQIVRRHNSLSRKASARDGPSSGQVEWWPPSGNRKRFSRHPRCFPFFRVHLNRGRSLRHRTHADRIVPGTGDAMMVGLWWKAPLAVASMLYWVKLGFHAFDLMRTEPGAIAVTVWGMIAIALFFRPGGKKKRRREAGAPLRNI